MCDKSASHSRNLFPQPHVSLELGSSFVGGDEALTSRHHPRPPRIEDVEMRMKHLRLLEPLCLYVVSSYDLFAEAYENLRAVVLPTLSSGYVETTEEPRRRSHTWSERCVLDIVTPAQLMEGQPLYKKL